MQCPECGRSVQPGDRFCNGCGSPLPDATEPTAPIPAVAGTASASNRDDATKPDDPAATAELTATGERAANDDAIAADELTATGETVAEMAANDDANNDAIAAAGHVTTDDPAATGEMAATPRTTDLPATELVEQVEDDGWGDDDPVWAATGAMPVTNDVRTGDLPTTEPITEVWMDRVDAAPGPTSASPTATTTSTSTSTSTTTRAADATATAAMPVTATPAPAAVPLPDHRFRFAAVTFLGIAGGVLLLVAMFATILEITSSDRLAIGDDAPAAFRLGTWIADDLADNLSIAGLVAALLMVLGGVGAAFGWRWSSGLAGGGGLAAAGLAALVIGLAQFPIDAAHEFAAIPTDEAFTLTITKSLGYWLLLAAGAVGIVVFFASTNDAFGDHRDGLNPWIAALGALAVVIAAGGPLLPDGTAVFSDNWYVIERPGEAPAMLVAMRLVQLGLFALGGVIGFLSVRRWGLGVATGATLPAVWLGVSTLFEIGDSPVGPGFRNPGSSTTELHGVTIIGLSAILAMIVLGAVAAYDQSVRARR